MNTTLTKDINPSKLATDYKGDLEKLIPTIDIAFVGRLMSDVFGVESPVYLPTWWQGREFKAADYTNVSIQEELEDDGSPIRFGQKTFGAFFLKGGQYKLYNQYTGMLETKGYSDFLMPLATLVDFSRQKIINKTPCIGSSGSVKEIYGFDDWSISIRGIIIPDKDNYPAFQSVNGQMYAMRNFFEIADSIEVDGKIFADKQINRICIESLTFSPVQGKPNMMQYSIEATSDEDILMSL